MRTERLLFLTSLLLGCSDKAPNSPPQADVAPVSDAAPTADAAPDPAMEEIRTQLRALMDRHACNRVTGCDGVVALARHGSALLGPAREALLSPRRPDGYWSLALIELLGQQTDPAATEVLAPLLRDRRWETRIAAARAMGLLGTRLAPQGKRALTAALTSASEGPSADPTFAAALRFALWRVGGDETTPAAAHREALIALLPRDEAAVMATPHPQLDALVRVVGDARLPEGLPTVRFALTTGNRFVVATALDVAGQLQDNGAIAYVLGLLDDRNPTLRKESVRALQRITGAHQLGDAAAWRTWAEQRGVKAITPQGSGGSSSPLGTDQGPDGP